MTCNIHVSTWQALVQAWQDVHVDISSKHVAYKHCLHVTPSTTQVRMSETRTCMLEVWGHFVMPLLLQFISDALWLPHLYKGK